MKELIQNLVRKANLNEVQATRTVEVFRSFLAEKLPSGIREPVLRVMGGDPTTSTTGAMGGDRPTAGR